MIVPTSVGPDAQQAFRDLNAFAQRWEGGRNVDLHGRRFVNAGPGVADEGRSRAGRCRVPYTWGSRGEVAEWPKAAVC